MAYSADGRSSDAGGALPSIWSSSLDALATEELHRYALLVPPGRRHAKPWRVGKDGYATLRPAATAEELRNHRGGRYNIYGRHTAFNDVINQYRRASADAGNPSDSQRRPRHRELSPSPRR
ncbi:hypothetical protein D1007_26519 [Hordeum vulgare]|nr:hypothetical protein D1007_26519 [Hordeum vulgare]